MGTFPLLNTESRDGAGTTLTVYRQVPGSSLGPEASLLPRVLRAFLQSVQRRQFKLRRPRLLYTYTNHPTILHYIHLAIEIFLFN